MRNTFAQKLIIIVINIRKREFITATLNSYIYEDGFTPLYVHYVCIDRRADLEALKSELTS